MLFLSGERGDLPSMREVEESVRKTFHASSAPAIELFYEHLDFARFPLDQHGTNDLRYLRDRYADRKIDLVFTVTGFGLEFALAHRDELFPGVPIVFCATDERELQRAPLPPDVTGIVGHFDIERTVQLIFTLQPGVSEIICVGGTSGFDRRWEEETRKVLEHIGDRVRVRWITDKSLEDTVREVSKAPPSSAVFFICMLRDGAGHSMAASDAVRDICRASSAPVYGFTSHFLDAGTVGGAVFDFGANGRNAANLALRILRGESVPLGTPELEIRNPIAVNWRALQKWKIPESRVPAEAEIRQKESTLWETHRGLIAAIVALVLIQAALIAGLILQRLWRRKAESSLRESEQRFRTIADAAPVLLWMSGPDKLCTFFNRAWLGFTGRTMQEELGNGWSTGVHADDLERTIAHYEFAFEEQEIFTMQYRLRRYDGEYRWVTDNGIPRYDTHENFLGYIGACVDVTDLLEKERALHEVEERNTLATEAAHLGVWEFNPQTNEVWISDKVRELFEFEAPSRISYDTFRDRIHPEDRDAREAELQRAIETCGSYETEYRIRLRDGTIRWIAGRARCINDGSGKSCRVLGVSMDVTERKQTEQLFQLAAEGVHLGVWDWDETSNKLLWDGATREIFDVPRQGEITLDMFYHAVYPADLAQVKEVWRGAFESGQPYQLDFRVQRSNGAIAWVHALGKGHYDNKGKPLRMIGIVFDITDRKHAEEEARQRRAQVDLLGRVSLLGEMTASLAHELNQPLSAIVSNASAGMRFIDKGMLDPEELREIFVDVADGGRRANDIIRNVRNAIKKGSAFRGRINLNDVVKSVTHLVAPDAAAHSCKVEASLKEDLPAIEGDPTQIQQALINLVRNAFDAMSETPPNRRRVQIATEHNGDGMVSVGVRDYGAGISASAQERLFEQFFTTKEEGLGLGLAIVRSIVENHGGRIGAENVDDGGARFYFNLPTSNGT